MDIKILRTRFDEATELLKIQNEAFQPDLERYQDYDSSPATEPIELFIERMNNSYHYTILIEGEIAGGIDIRKISNTHYRLFRIFLKPHYQNRGFGTKIMILMEQIFPIARRWSLDTPKNNLRNHHFYEKLGYKKAGEHKINDKLTLLEYEKEKNA